MDKEKQKAAVEKNSKDDVLTCFKINHESKEKELKKIEEQIDCLLPWAGSDFCPNKVTVQANKVENEVIAMRDNLDAELVCLKNSKEKVGTGLLQILWENFMARRRQYGLIAGKMQDLKAKLKCFANNAAESVAVATSDDDDSDDQSPQRGGDDVVVREQQQRLSTRPAPLQPRNDGNISSYAAMTTNTPTKRKRLYVIDEEDSSEIEEKESENLIPRPPPQHQQQPQSKPKKIACVGTRGQGCFAPKATEEQMRYYASQKKPRVVSAETIQLQRMIDEVISLATSEQESMAEQKSKEAKGAVEAGESKKANATMEEAASIEAVPQQVAVEQVVQHPELKNLKYSAQLTTSKADFLRLLPPGNDVLSFVDPNTNEEHLASIFTGGRVRSSSDGIVYNTPLQWAKKILETEKTSRKSNDLVYTVLKYKGKSLADYHMLLYYREADCASSEQEVMEIDPPPTASKRNASTNNNVEEFFDASPSSAASFPFDPRMMGPWFAMLAAGTGMVLRSMSAQQRDMPLGSFPMMFGMPSLKPKKR